jgi:hypothetical protein
LCAMQSCKAVCHCCSVTCNRVMLNDSTNPIPKHLQTFGVR